MQVYVDDDGVPVITAALFCSVEETAMSPLIIYEDFNLDIILS